MAYDQGYPQQQRPYNGPGPQRGGGPRQYPPGGPGGPQQYNGPQYDQHQEGYDYGYDDYGNGGFQDYGAQGGQYDDYNQGPPNQNYPPQDRYGPGPGRGRPPPGGRGGPMPRPMGGDGGRGPYPPRGGGPHPGPGRGGPGRGVNPGGRGGMNGPTMSPTEQGFGGSPFPAFPGQQRRTDRDEEQGIIDQMGGMDLSGRRPNPPGNQHGMGSQRGPRGPPPPQRGYPQQGYPEPRRGPGPDQGYGPPADYREDGFGPPARTMTMPTNMDPMRHQAPPPRSDSIPHNFAGPGRGMPPPRPSTAQGGRGPPQRFPQQGGYQGSYDDSFAPAPRPSSFDDVYDNYQQQGGSGDFPAREPYAAPTQSDMPNFDGVPAHRPRGSFDQHMNSGEQGLPQRGPSRVPELNRTKSQPDLRQPQQVVFEMAGDIPPLPPMGNQYQAGTPDQPSGPAGGYSQQGPGPGLPNGPGPARRGSEASSQSPSNPDSLPSHPTPIRPGLMPNSVASQMVNKPAPVRNYGGPVPPTGTMSSTPVPIQPAVPAAGALDPPVTPELLERLRNTIKSDPNDQASALILAKKLVQAMELLVPNLPDPRTRAKARDRYSMDAHKILKKLAGAQNPDAMFFMADCLGKGIFGPEPDNKEAFTLYQSAAKLGNAAAAYRTAVCCEIGNEDGGGTRRDPLKAIQWYKRACLSPETMVRTTTGNKATRDIQVGDMLLDDEDRPVQCLTAGPIQTSSNMKTVKYQEYDSSKNVSFKCTSDHIMTLRATNVKPFVAANSRVFWHTRCDRSEVREDAEDIKWDQVMHELFTELSDELGRRPTEGEARRYIHAVTDPRIVPDSQDEDPQMHDDPVHSVSPAMFEVMHRLEKLGVDVDDMGPGIGLRVLEHMNEYLENFVPEGMAIPDDDDDLDIYVDAPRPRPFATLSRMPSSSMYPSDASFHPASEVSKEDLMEKFAIVREKLNSPKTSAKCKNQACKGIRVASARFKTDEQARFAANLLSGDHYRVIDPYVVKEFDLFTMTLEEYQATCHYQQNPVLRKMRLYRSPLSYLPANAPSSSVPIDPYWLGFWLGAGNNHKPLVSSSDMEIKVYCQTYVDRLNREGAAGTVGLHLAEEVASKAGDSTTFPDGRTCTNNVATYNWSLSLNSRGAGAKNPITQGLRDLGLYQDKSGGIPDCYRNADEDTRLAVLAGLIESHGSLSQRTNVYCFSQTTYEHKKMVEDAQKLATSCGIQCTQVSESQTAREPTWRFWMSKGSEKFQHHLLTPRKRLDASKVVNRRQNRDMRSFDVEDAGEGQYRLIEVSGGLYQLADRTVVHNCTLGDTPAMYKVGMILLKGLLGQPRNPREAVGWLKRAAERADPENPHALHELGLLYENARPEDVILRDEVYAFSLFKQAADLGYKFSQFRMGCAYEYGLMGCPIDPRLSIMWYSKAATQEEHQSELALSGWYLTGSEGVLQQSDTEAYLWARKAAMAGLAKAEYAMGYFTEVGIGVPASMEDAKRWYWRAAAQNFPKARERLEDLKRSGKNGPRQRERISRSKMDKGQEGECTVM